MSQAKLQDLAFYQDLISTMPGLVDGMHYVLVVISPEGGALQVSNVDPEGQRYYLQNCLDNMNHAKAEFIPGRDKH